MAANIIKNFLPSTVSTNRIINASPANISHNKGVFSWFSKNASSKTSDISLADTKNIGFRLLAYFLAIFIAIMVILLFIHFMITPIFILHPGDPGYIPFPGFDDGKLYWSSGLTGIIPNNTTPIKSSSYNYSLILDTFIENPLQFSQTPRILFTRAATVKETPTSETLLGLYRAYNLVIGLLPDTNDLIVSVMNKDNNMENAVIPNIPVQQSIRIGVIIMEQAMEVYINGNLVKTRKFASPPKDVNGDIAGPLGINTNIFKVRNLKIWDRILKTTEIRYATPSKSSDKDFGATVMPGTSTGGCPTLSKIDSNIENRLEKLSV
jgi:hypothetical protein